MKIIRELNYEYEAHVMFSRYVCDTARYALRASNKVKEKIDFVYEQSIPIMDQLMKDYPEITHVIRVFEAEKSFIGFTSILDIDFEHNKQEALTTLSNEILVENLGKKLEVDPEMSLIDILEQTTLTAEQKWLIVLVLENSEKYYSDLTDIYAKLIPLLERLLQNFNEELDLLYTEWQERINNGTIFQFLEEEVGLGYEDKNLKIQISVMGMNAIVIRKDIAMVGITFTKDFFERAILTVDEACKNLKNLGDVSKFSILQELVESQKYGKELATKLDLTPATISYHIQELVSDGLVQVNASKTTNRIYYEIRKEKIFEILMFVTNTLELLTEENKALIAQITDN